MTPTVSSGSPEKRNHQTRPSPDVSTIFNVPPLPSTVDVFSRMGGLGLLAKHLPVVYPETLRQVAVGSKFTGTVGLVTNMDKDSPHTAEHDWVKIENADEFYDVN